MSSDDDNNSGEFIKGSTFLKKKNTVQKKRGRPKKTDSNQKTTKLITPTQSENEDEEIILHLPLDDDDKESSSEKNLFTMKDESECKHFVDSIDSDDSNDQFSTKQLITEMKKKDVLIKKLKDSIINIKKNNLGYSEIYGTLKSRMINLKLLDINKSNTLVVVDKTHIACWWCSHNFDTLPCFIPDRLCDGKYYVFGCFCTYSCAMAYNLNMNDYRVSIRTSLIKKLAQEIFGQSAVPVAPPKELLIKFGGDIPIDDFRNSALLCKKEFKVQIPPLIPLIMNVNENQRV